MRRLAAAASLPPAPLRGRWEPLATAAAPRSVVPPRGALGAARRLTIVTGAASQRPPPRLPPRRRQWSAAGPASGQLRGRAARPPRANSLDGAQPFDDAFDDIGADTHGASVEAAFTAAGAVRTLSGHLFVNYDAFERLCLKVLKLQLAQSEVVDVFSAVDSDADGYISSQDFLGHIESGRHRVLLCCMLHMFRMHEFNKQYAIPTSYDFTRPTNDSEVNHGSSERYPSYVGRFTDVRESIDYVYHGGYSHTRQEWQDEVVSSLMMRSEPKAMPWLVYTCGGYGTGKGFCVSWMSEHGFFPLADVVCIDPDHLKQVMPEWEEYIRRDQDAGTLCHAESAYMEELVQALAMRNRQNVWIDGSLSNTEWFKGLFQDSKERYPFYSIAIFYIFASEARARARIAARRRATGRGIPDDAVTRSLEGARSSVDALTPYVDFVARVDNDGEVPILRSAEVIDRSGSWGSIARRFARPQARLQDFPRALAPLGLRRLPEEAVQAMTFLPQREKLRLDLAQICRAAISEGGSAALPQQEAQLLEAHLPGHLELDASTVRPVTADPDMRRMAALPAQGETDFCYVYQRQTAAETDSLKTRDFIKASSYSAAEGFPALVEFLKFGGFVFLDGTSGAVRGASCVSKRPGTGMLQFGPRQPLPEGPHAELTALGRWYPVTLGRLRAARHYTWIAPAERIAGEPLGGPHGALAYVLEDGHAWVFPVSPLQEIGPTRVALHRVR